MGDAMLSSEFHRECRSLAPRSRTLSDRVLWFLAVFLFLAAACSSSSWAAELPQVSPEAMRDILAAPLMPAEGPADADVTVVEYLDYNCPVCKATAGELRTLLRKDHKVRVIYKDWPIFGATSAYAAYATMAAERLGQYQAAHDALISSPKRLESQADVLQVLRAAGLDVERIQAQIAEHRQTFSATLTRNHVEVTGLGAEGTPIFLVGDRMIIGGVKYEDLQRVVSLVRGSSSAAVNSPGANAWYASEY
jgi:protein-disulfide isomerase